MSAKNRYSCNVSQQVLSEFVHFRHWTKALQKLCLGQLCQPQRSQIGYRKFGQIINRVGEITVFGYRVNFWEAGRTLLSKIATAGATTAAVTEKVWGEYVAASAKF